MIRLLAVLLAAAMSARPATAATAKCVDPLRPAESRALIAAIDSAAVAVAAFAVPWEGQVAYTCTSGLVARLGHETFDPRIPIKRLPDRRTDALDAYFKRLAENHGFSGAVLVALGDSILLRQGYGLAHADLGVRNTPEMRYRTASLTKTFTAAAIAVLAERGKLSLQDPLTRFIPGFPNGDSISIRRLLGHSSGLANPDYTRALGTEVRLAELVDTIAAKQPLFAPGSRSAYSNAGYNVLARVIEIAAGESYESFLRREFFRPLGMNATGEYDPRVVVAMRAAPHIPGPPPTHRAYAPQVSIGYDVGSGSLWSTVDDLHRWARAIHSNRFFNRAALAYPYGWGRLGAEGTDGLEQTGLATGFTSSLSIWFTDSLYVVILGNMESAHWAAWPTDVASIVRKDTLIVPDLVALQPTDSVAAAALVGDYESEGTVAAIRWERGGLWLYLNDWPVPKYLDAAGATRFSMRSEVGMLEFGGSQSAAASTFDWVYPSGSRRAFTRR